VRIEERAVLEGEWRKRGEILYLLTNGLADGQVDILFISSCIDGVGILRQRSVQTRIYKGTGGQI
jgi:hypothetical protein